MKLLRRLLSKIRRPTKAADPYGTEVLFAGWVDLPQDLLRQRDPRASPADSKRVTQA